MGLCFHWPARVASI